MRRISKPTIPLLQSRIIFAQFVAYLGITPSRLSSSFTRIPSGMKHPLFRIIFALLLSNGHFWTDVGECRLNRDFSHFWKG